MADPTVKGPASYFPSIEKNYGRPIAEWQAIVRKHMPANHLELVQMLKTEHGMGHGHANTVVESALASRKKGGRSETSVPDPVPPQFFFRGVDGNRFLMFEPV